MSLTRRQVLAAGSGALAVTAMRPAMSWIAPKPFRFAFFSDTHVNIGRNLKENADMLAEISALNPAFAINAGDITDNAWRNQIELYQELVKGLKFRLHHCPGNHDVRWSPLGMQIFRESFGEPNRAFEHGGCWFILLNSTVPLSHWGNLDSNQMAWLRETLAKIGKRAPIFVFSHHWLGRESQDTSRPVVQVDNEFDVIEELRPYNVRMIGCGHGHSDLRWEVEGTPAFMNRGLYQFSYMVVDVDPMAGTAKIWKRTAEKPELTELETIDLRAVASGGGEEVTVGQVPGGPIGLSDSVAETRWNEGIWRKREGSETRPPAGIAGFHTLYVRSDDRLAALRADVEVELPAGALRRLWAADLPGGVMSHVRLDGDQLFLSMMDGSVQCRQAKDGSLVWSAKTGGYCHSSPLVAGFRVFVGSADGHLYAFRRRDGRLLWKKRLPGPVYASPAFAKGVVFIANFGAFFGLDPESGKEIWRTPMPESNTPFAQSVAATDGEVFVQGCWDSHLYGLDATSGRQLWREACQPRTFAFSPAIGSPVIADGHVYVVANGNGLFKFDVRTGERKWEVASAGQKFGHSGPVVAPGGRVIAGNLGDGEGEVRCMSAEDGRELWVTKTGFTIYDSCPRLGDGFVAIHSVPGIVNVISVEDGRLIGQFRLGQGHALGTAAVDKTKIYSASFAQRLVAIEVVKG